MIRLICPQCDKGINAPSRLRKNDIRRYCLRCSESDGVLVERYSPKRKTRKRKQDERARAVRARSESEYKKMRVDTRHAFSAAIHSTVWQRARSALGAELMMVNNNLVLRDRVTIDVDNAPYLFYRAYRLDNANRVIFDPTSIVDSYHETMIEAVVRCAAMLCVVDFVLHDYDRREFIAYMRDAVVPTCDTAKGDRWQAIRIMDKIARAYNRSARRTKWNLPEVDTDVVSGFTYFRKHLEFE